MDPPTVSDIAALVDSKRLMFGVGTFGPAMCLLSDHIEEVYYHETIHLYGYRDMPNIKRCFAVHEIGKDYIQSGHWQNTEEQRALMLSFGEDLCEVCRC